MQLVTPTSVVMAIPVLLSDLELSSGPDTITRQTVFNVPGVAFDLVPNSSEMAAWAG